MSVGDTVIMSAPDGDTDEFPSFCISFSFRAIKRSYLIDCWW